MSTRRNFRDAAFVELRVFLPALGKSATITRKVSAPKKPKIEPADDDVVAALDEVAEHPEITLSRRDILRFIVVAASERSERIQTLLKLDEIGKTRSAFNAAQKKLRSAEQTATHQAKAGQEAVERHLQVSSLDAAAVSYSIVSGARAAARGCMLAPGTTRR